MTDTSTTTSIDDFTREITPGSSKRAMAGIKSRDLWQLPPQKLRFMEGFNTRIEGLDLDKHIRELADSMKSEGFYMDKPVSVIIAREGDEDIHYVTDGHCRTKAALLAISEGAPIETIPCVTEDRSTTMEDLTVKLYRANTGRPLTPFETGLVCKRLIRFGWDEKKVASQLCLGTEYVKGLLLLVGSPRVIRDAVTSNQISATEAIKLLRQFGDKAVEELQARLNKALREGKSRVSGKHASDAPLKRALKATAPRLHQAAKQIQADPAFAALQAETRDLLVALLQELAIAEQASQPATTPTEEQPEQGAAQ